MTAYFVTGSGTDIGKTFVTAGLIRALRRRARSVAALKPVMSGFDVAEAAASDAGILLSALGRAATMPEIDRIAPWRFAAPVSPDMAARREGRRLDFAALVNFTGSAIAHADGVLLIEGVGGVMVPLDERHTVIDWIAALRLPALLVAGSYLGALSHTLTALDTLRRRELMVAALVVNESAHGVPLGETVATLARFAPDLSIRTVPRGIGAATDWAFDSLAALL